jgi:3-oxoacyl-[acyl-carrier protein] reductase
MDMTEESISRTAVVTGASQGIAQSAAIELAAHGTDIVLVARREAQLLETAELCKNAGVTAHAVVGDVSTAEGCDHVIATINGLVDDVDILVNAVGAMAAPTAKHVNDFSDEDWLLNFELNLMSGVRLCRAFVPGMVDRGWGRVVNFSSLVGVEPEPFVAPYAAAKAAVLAFTKALARDVAASGVTCNAIIPGLINTPKIASRSIEVAERTGRTPEDILAAELKRRPIPVGRPGLATELAPVIALLCSAQSSFITGIAIPVDGGAIRQI